MISFSSDTLTGLGVRVRKSEYFAPYLEGMRKEWVFDFPSQHKVTERRSWIAVWNWESCLPENRLGRQKSGKKRHHGRPQEISSAPLPSPSFSACPISKREKRQMGLLDSPSPLQSSEN
jgi:hypothetical protein